MIDPYELARAEQMLLGYSARWFDEPFEVLHVEAEFDGPLVNPETGAESRTFAFGGKIDVVVRDLRLDRVLVVEHKTSSEDCSPGSIYWRRLRLNPQSSGYLVGARVLGFDPWGVLWDVLVKPAIRPSAVPLVDDQGVKIVHDAAGQRVRTKDGKKWRETASSADGYVLQTRPETVDEFRERLAETIAEKPDEHFRRGDVVRLLEEERDAAHDAWQTAAAIREGRRARRFPRNPDSCMKYNAICPFFDVCTGDASIDDRTRYRRVVNVHEELTPRKTRLPLLTNSELSTHRACTRLHHYRYDLGYRSLAETDAQRFGTLVHRALEGWWLGKRDGLAESACIERAFEKMTETPPPAAFEDTAATAAREAIVL